MKRNNGRASVAVLILFLALIVGIWWFFVRTEKVLDEKAEPRAVTARGDLAQDEKTAVEIFKNVSKSVVYISSIELRRDFFSLDSSMIKAEREFW
jgi:hypothetical protein